MGVLCLSLFWYALLCVLFSFAIIWKRKRELLLSNGCLVTVNVLSQWLFLKVPRVGLQFVILVFPDHTHFSKLFGRNDHWMT